MLRYLVCEDRAHRAFLRLMVLDDLFNTFIPEIPTSSFYVTSLWDNIRVRVVSDLILSILPSSCNIDDYL